MIQKTGQALAQVRQGGVDYMSGICFVAGMCSTQTVLQRCTHPSACVVGRWCGSKRLSSAPYTLCAAPSTKTL